jgi:hypothetical protein
MLRVLHCLDVEHGQFKVHAAGRERAPHDLGQLLQEHRSGCAGVHSPAAGGEPDRQARLDVSDGHNNRGARHNDLGGALNLHAPAPARAAVSAHDLAYGFLDATREKVLKSDPTHRICE